MDQLLPISEVLAEIDGRVADNFRAISNGFQKLEKIKDSSRQSRLLEDLTDKMRDSKRLIKEFDKEIKTVEGNFDRETSKMLNEKKQSRIKELNSYVALKKQYATNIDNKRIELLEGPNEDYAEKNVMLASSMTNEQLMDRGNHMMDETDQAIERGQKVIQDTVNVGTEASAALKAQTEQMSKIVNELDSIHFSIGKASQLVKDIGRQVATDKCIMALLFLIVVGIVVVIVVKLVHPHNKSIPDIPGLAPPAVTNRRLFSHQL
ncbi:putative target SNARE coiled-coil domain-containing protein [Lupinus albus]|uniref:Putative target SNARE coiled-coil domain-containing protein n=1 Tax=Lupinus albus TaxID=3870 RepID=A0A6A4P6L7_LUPAL|nr:putative target SNARE coiled-coil domain-containing protein [Lupinus albus]